MPVPIFDTDYVYSDRETKAKYVWLKYRSILVGQVLDVGADERYLRQYLGPETKYWGIGLGGSPDQQVNLELEEIPFPDSSFDCVLCLDVLEHLDNIHEIFDQVCRVTRKYAIISLPNPWADFVNLLFFAARSREQPLKFYGLPADKANDRHKWFFSIEEAQKFITDRAARNRMQVVQMDIYRPCQSRNPFRQILHALILKVLSKTSGSNSLNFRAGTLWSVLEKQSVD